MPTWLLILFFSSGTSESRPRGWGLWWETAPRPPRPRSLTTPSAASAPPRMLNVRFRLKTIRDELWIWPWIWPMQHLNLYLYIPVMFNLSVISTSIFHQAQNVTQLNADFCYKFNEPAALSFVLDWWTEDICLTKKAANNIDNWYKVQPELHSA